MTKTHSRRRTNRRLNSAVEADRGFSMAMSKASKEQFNAPGMYEEVDLIDLMNALQNKLTASGHSLDLSLPQIVVVGCQSAGKSSVLESFVGKEFLPRGTKLVTRRPILVQLIPCADEYGIFLHKEDVRFTDFNAIKEEIVRLTDEECGPQGFSKNPISLRIFSPRVLKLTVVDLPGIIRVAVEGQLEESVQIVRDMVLEHITKEKCIILAVTPAGLDIANSDALDIAKIADPNRERTIGVLTKLDLMDEGTHAREVLENIQVPLKRGWVGVINRSHKDVLEGKDMDYMLEKEKKFFENNEYYSHMSHRMGTRYLQKLLQKTLRSHIKECLPAVRTELTQKLHKFKKELREFESVMGEGPNAREYYIIKLMQRFCNDVNVNIMGYSELVATDTLTPGALINYKLYTEVQRNIVSQKLLPDEEQLSKLIANLNGIRNSISVPALAVDGVCRKLIETFKYPLEQSVDCVCEVLLDSIKKSSELINSYPSLKNELLFRIEHWIEQESENTKERLKSHVDAEMFYVNLGHPDFDSSACDPVAPPAGPVSVWSDEDSGKAAANEEKEIMAHNLQQSQQMQKQVKYVSAVVIKYLEIIQKQMVDVAIKYIAFFLVKKVLTCINDDLVPTVVDSANIKSLTEDCDNDFARKEEMEMSCDCLTEALSAIQAF